MTTEQYSIGYEEGYQDGWNEAIDNELSNKSIAQIEIKNGHWINTPFADVKNLDDGLHNLYTSPPASKPWVGLTDEDIDQGLLRSDYAFKTAEAWRAGVVFAMTKLKEKNNG